MKPRLSLLMLSTKSVELGAQTLHIVRRYDDTHRTAECVVETFEEAEVVHG